MAAIKIKLSAAVIIIILTSFVAAQARTTLVSLPLRQTVAIRLGDMGKTLIQEKRILTLKKGMNKIDFSWQNVMIDPSSITLATLSNPDKIKILSVSYPPNEAALIWDIESQDSLEEEVMISYLLANIDGMVTYKAVADKKETVIDLNTYLVLRNFSGENFDRITAFTRLGKPFNTTIQHLETKRILVSRERNIPIKKVYTWDALKMPHEPEKERKAVGIPTSYEFVTSLHKGKARLFQEDNQGSSIFLGEDNAKFTPKGEKTTLQIGDSRDIRVTQLRIDTKRTNIKLNTKGKMQVYDELCKDRITMENLKESPVTLSLIQTIPGQWKPVDISMPYTQKDHKILVFNVTLLPKEKKTLNMHYKILNIFAQKFSRYNRVHY